MPSWDLVRVFDDQWSLRCLTTGATLHTKLITVRQELLHERQRLLAVVFCLLLSPQGNTTAGRSVDHACMPCLPGFFCPIEGLTYAALRMCSSGSYCPSRSILPTACPAGFFQPESGMTSVAACQVCPAGFFCPRNTSSYTENICEPGYVCPTGSETGHQVPCPAGEDADYYIVASIVVSYSNRSSRYQVVLKNSFSTRELCCIILVALHLILFFEFSCYSTESQTKLPTGTYSNRSGVKRTSQCNNCTVGHYCPQATVQPIPCQPGTFGPLMRSVSASNCRECLAGWACETSAIYAMTTRCAPGHYCPRGTSSATQYPCPAGYFTNFTNLTSVDQCTECPAGFACWRGAVQPSMDCSPGYACPAGTSPATMTPCPAGTYSASYNLEATSDCSECDAGYFCSGGETAPSGSCLQGRYCPGGDSIGTACPAGIFQCNNWLLLLFHICENLP